MKYYNVEILITLDHQTDTTADMDRIACEFSNEGLVVMLPSASEYAVDGWEQFALNDWEKSDYYPCSEMCMHIDGVEVADDLSVETWTAMANDDIMNAGIVSGFNEMADNIAHDSNAWAFEAITYNDETAEDAAKSACASLDDVYDFLADSYLENCSGIQELLDQVQDIKEQVECISDDVRGYGMFNVIRADKVEVYVYEVTEED